MVYAHPVLGAITLGLLVWLGVLGLRARHRARYAPAARRLHRRLSNAVAVLFALSAAGGLGSVWWLREDLSPAASRHFIAAVVGLMWMVALWALGRRLPRDPTARRLHPWAGYASLLTAAALLVLGFGLLP